MDTFKINIFQTGMYVSAYLNITFVFRKHEIPRYVQYKINACLEGGQDRETRKWTDFHAPVAVVEANERRARLPDRPSVDYDVFSRGIIQPHLFFCSFSFLFIIQDEMSAI